MKPHNKRNILLLSLLGLIIVVFAIWYGVSGKSSQLSSGSDAKQPKPVLVEVQPVKLGAIAQTLELSGEIIATESIIIAATKEGPITYCPFREGDVVKAGEKLVEIDRKIYRAEVQMAQAALAVAQAKLADLKAEARPEEIKKTEASVQRWEATFEEARKNHEREQQLLEKKFTSQQSVDQAHERMVVAEAELTSARETLLILKVGPTLTEIAVQSSVMDEAAARLELARVHLDECVVTAPFDGIIQKVYVSSGDLASARAPLIEMFAPDSLVLRFVVPEAYFSDVRSGLKLAVTLDAIPGKEFSAEVIRVYPQIDAVTRTRTVEARFTELAELVPNMFARLVLELQKVENAVLIPYRSVLTTPEGEHVVFVVEEGKAHKRKVELGISHEQMVQAVKGLKPGDKIVVSGQGALKDGQAIKIIGQDKKEGGSPTEKTESSKSSPKSSPGAVDGQ